MSPVDYTFPGRPVGGKRAPSRGPVLRLADFATGVLPARPASVDDLATVILGLDANDRAGDCVATGWDNFHRIVTRLLTGTEQQYTLDQVIAWYRTQNPDFDINGTAQTNGPGSSADGGMDMQTFLIYLVKAGVILGFASVDPKDDAEIETALYLFLATYFGGTLQVAQQAQSDSGYWDYVPGSGTWGGHCFVGGTYDQVTGKIGVASWAEVIEITAAWRAHCLDEAYVILTHEHVARPDFRAGFDLPKYAAAWTAITGRPFPVPVTPVPTPPPTPPTPPGPAQFPGALVAAVTALARDPKVAVFLQRAHIGVNADVADHLRAVLAAPRA